LERFRAASYRYGEQTAKEEQGPVSPDDVPEYMNRFFSMNEVAPWAKTVEEFNDQFYMGWDTYYQQNIV
jgi:hypothetical protein